MYNDVNFSNQDLSESLFNHCHFYICNFSWANLRDTQFVDCLFIEQGAIEGCHFIIAIFASHLIRTVNYQCQISKGRNVSVLNLGIVI